MAITTVAVSVHVDDTNGVLAGAKVNAKLNRVEVYQGHIVPEFTTATTDVNGDATLDLWPNALGVTESSYEITIIDPNSRHVASFLATIPNSACNLWDVANLPAYPGKSDSQRAADAALVSETAAAASETAAAASETAAAASYDSFDDRYLGAFAVAPTLDNDGDALLTGALYFDTVANAMYAWSGSAWSATFPAASSIVDNGNATAITISSDEDTSFSGTVIQKVGTDIASASALPLVAGGGNIFDVTGTAAITSINTLGIGSVVVLQFDGILTLTNHATDIVLPNGDNILTYAGYTIVLYEYAAGDFRFICDNTVVPLITSITGTVATNALTVGLNATRLNFRSATLTDGLFVMRSTSDISVVVPSGATLGAIDTIQSRIILLAIDNAGTVELAVVNLAGGVNLNEEGVISTTAIDATADSNNVVYSTTARSNVAYRVVGLLDSTQATAGTWATSPTLIQGAGGNALTSMSSLGYGQTWQNPTRVTSTTYYNTTSKPIYVSISITTLTNGSSATLFVDSIDVSYIQSNIGAANAGYLSAIIPVGSSYYTTFTVTAAILEWSELR